MTSLSYTGIGLGASDVAFMMATSVSPSVLQHHEDDLLRFYYRRLREWLEVNKNRSVMDGSFTWGRFMGQYKMAQLVYVYIDKGARLYTCVVHVAVDVNHWYPITPNKGLVVGCMLPVVTMCILILRCVSLSVPLCSTPPLFVPFRSIPLMSLPLFAGMRTAYLVSSGQP